MKWAKMKISIERRIYFLKHAVTWLATTTIPVCGDGYQYESVLDFKERWQCFVGSLDTARIGYLWRLEE